ncbi:MAG: hypothetical protein HQ515_16140 [Phycisphaeraceae bacterium]|nr:hypothetical protein [Phycisphaeraceae bacterium]
MTVRNLMPVFVATLLTLLFCSGFAQAAIPFEEALKEASVTLTSLQDGQRDGLILGNGDLYAIVWEKDNGLFMRITKNDIWDARVDTSKDGELPRVNVVNHRVSGSKGAPPSYGKLYPQPRCAAALRLGPVSASQAMRADLDIEKAFVSVNSTPHQETTLRILHDRNVVLIRSPHAVTLEAIQAETLPAATLGTSEGVAWLLMNMPGDIDYKGMDYAVALATKGDLKSIALVTSFDIKEGDVLKEAIALAQETIAIQETTLIAEHEKAWQRYWSRSGLQLEDKVLQRWWYRQLYFAQTVCKPGTAPVALMPPLATDNTPWHADYHFNYNSWQAFWPLPASNHSELTDPWISYVLSQIPRFSFLARETYDCDGMFCPISAFLHEPDPADCQMKNKRQLSMNPWGLTIGETGMTVQNAWQKHLCDPDIEYLKTKIYPIVRESARFYVSFMSKCQKDDHGKILLGPSYSPEHGPMGIFNCPFDIAYVHYTFDALIEAAEELKLDEALAAECRQYRALLGDYPTAMDANGNPIVVDWKGCNYKQVPVHNITVPASPVFPCDQVTWFSPEPEKDLFKRTIRDTRFNGNNSHVMFNIAKARLSMLEGITDAKTWFMSRELPNGLFVWKGHQHGTYMPEMIGVVGLVNEFLLQSVQNKIRLFPCWPTDKNAAFTGLRAQGGFVVSAEFAEGRVISVTIESTVGKQLQLLSPWKTVYVNGKKTALDPNGLVTLNTRPGQVLHFSETRN